MKNKLIEIYGWYGVVAIVSAYILVSFSIVSATSLTYQILNGTGALGVVFVSFHKRNYQPGVLNIIWTVIACIAILKIVL
jgi:multidrug transporter EmrE-like cation transporter